MKQSAILIIILFLCATSYAQRINDTQRIIFLDNKKFILSAEMPGKNILFFSQNNDVTKKTGIIFKSLSTPNSSSSREETKFSKADKIGSIIGGALVGCGVGIVAGIAIFALVEKPKQGEGLGALPYAYVGGAVGAVSGSIIFYKINENISKKENKKEN